MSYAVKRNNYCIETKPNSNISNENCKIFVETFRRENPDSREDRVKGVWNRKNYKLYSRSTNYMAVLLYERWVGTTLTFL